MVSFCCEIFLLCAAALMLTFFIAGLLFICASSTSITWERTPHPVRRPAFSSHLFSAVTSCVWPSIFGFKRHARDPERQNHECDDDECGHIVFPIRTVREHFMAGSFAWPEIVGLNPRVSTPTSPILKQMASIT